MRNKRFFTPEFKKEDVALALQPDMHVGKVAKDLDLTPSALARWMKQFRPTSSTSKTKGNDPTVEQLKKQCQKQQKQIRLLTMERDILKKATTFFAKESE